jgi:hypothetical protein
MRVTIIPIDGSVSVDGKRFGELNLSFMDASVHAVQWYETHGEIEVKDPVTGRMVANEIITSIDAFQPAIDVWQAAKTAAAEALARAANNQPTTTGSQTL